MSKCKCPHCGEDIDPSSTLANMQPADLRTLRAIINGKLSKRTISPEQQQKMQDARNR